MTVLLDFFLFDPETVTKGEYNEIFDFLGFDEPVSFLLYIIALMAAGVFDICYSFLYLLWKICKGSGD
jgi:hypothetical protein